MACELATATKLKDAQPRVAQAGRTVGAKRPFLANVESEHVPGVFPEWDKVPGVCPKWDKVPGVFPEWDKVPGVYPEWDKVPGTFGQTVEESWAATH